MKQKLSGRDYTYVASMLFGMFFGAGNLIFPIHMGQMAGSNIWPAIIGFCVTGVGLPLLGVAALGISRSGGLFELGSRVGKPYSMFFTCLLYLTIGPFFAIPRCATTSFTVGLEQVLPQGGNMRLCLLAFSAAFFAAALFFSLRPGKILVWVGKVLNPCFLLFLGILVIVAMLRPGAAVGAVVPEGAYASQPFFTGFLEGYNTMDALASLAFGIVVVQVIRDLGVTEPDAVAGSTVRAGIFSCLLMAAIYVAVTVVGVQSRGLFETSENGGIALAQIAQHYLGSVGLLILAATVTLACLKTSVGLITSCAETFTGLFPKGPTYRVWAVIFSLVSLLFANFGLSSIIGYSVPVLMFLYPLAITLIALSLFGKFFAYDRAVFVWTTALTLVGALYDFAAALPAPLLAACRLDGGLATQTVILLGVMFSMLATSLTSLVSLLFPEKLRSITFWTMGSLQGSDYAQAALLAAALALAGGTLYFTARELNAFTLGEEQAGNLGVNVRSCKLRVLFCVAALTGVSVAVGGGIGFVGLLVPHMTRRLLGPDHGRLLPGAACFGATFLLLADLLSRVLLRPLELPVGAVTSLVGAGAFVYIFYTTRRKNQGC